MTQQADSSFVSFEGKRVLVTGGSRGVGRATAVLFGRLGADVAIMYRSRTADATSTVQAVQAHGVKAAAFAADLGDASAAATEVDAAAAFLGHIDFLVANAGIWPPDDVPVASMSDEQWRVSHRANLDSVFFTIRAALPHMRSGGSVVIVSSTAGQRGEAFHADYASTKGAVIALTKSLAVELAPALTVNCVAPGWIDTEMAAPAYQDGGLQAIASSIPTQRVASPEDVAGPIVFLCSEWARQINGEIVNVNGGSVLCG